ncbi:MAG TPA: 4Fe-4S dicluster domain-containing protein [Gaiellaceae bacterium]|nr:4Fe-4S dicluster domain-containing protein [Gaiellaceae bacterium]
MTRWGMVIDLDRCVGCNACTLACKIENGTPPDHYWARVYTEETGTFPNVTTTYVPALCNHCADAPCVTVCPTGASHQRDDGIVLVDQDTCIGCRACMMACPYSNRFYLRKGVLETGYHGERTPFEDAKWAAFTEGTVTKCTFCAHRVDGGLEPACVITCPTDARIFGDLDDPDSRPSRLIRDHDGQQPLPEMGTNPSVYYVESRGARTNGVPAGARADDARVLDTLEAT